VASADLFKTPLDPDMAVFCEVLSKATPAGAETWPLPKQRAAWDALCQSFRAARPLTITVVDMMAHGVAIRVFTPKTPGPHAAVLYGHGGGWVLGGPETHDDICAELAAGAGCMVVLVDYRLAPEHPHPAQLEDCLKVWRWMVANPAIDRNRIMAAGDSAGGQMVVALALTLRDLGLPQLAAMVLIYPVLGANLETPSYRRNANAPGLSRSEMSFYLRSFLGPEGSPAWCDEKALPLLAQSLEGLPPAFITVAGHDPLYDDGVMFHQRLLGSGIDSRLREEPALAHSYMRARHHSAVAKAGFEAILTAVKDFVRVKI
jgi:acetyl esterase